MGVVGFSIKSVNAYMEEGVEIKEGINVNSVPTVTGIKKRDVSIPGMKDILSVDFEFVTRYTPKLGEITIKGEVVYQAEDAKKMLDSWKNKKLDSKIAAEILNTIFKKCLTKAVSIADDLRLPPPLTFPMVKVEKAASRDKSAA